jgi:hypothetical protein
MCGAYFDKRQFDTLAKRLPMAIAPWHYASIRDSIHAPPLQQKFARRGKRFFYVPVYMTY